MKQLQLKSRRLQSLHRRRRNQARFELTSNPSAAHEFNTHAERIRMQYFEALDILITAVKERFNERGIEKLLKVEELIMLYANITTMKHCLKLCSKHMAKILKETVVISLNGAVDDIATADSRQKIER